MPSRTVIELNRAEEAICQFYIILYPFTIHDIHGSLRNMLHKMC